MRLRYMFREREFRQSAQKLRTNLDAIKTLAFIGLKYVIKHFPELTTRNCCRLSVPEIYKVK